MPLLINVFPVADIINHKAGAFQLKKCAAISGAKAIFVLEPLEFLERAEEAGDLAWLKKARRKPPQYRPLEEYLAGRTRG